MIEVRGRSRALPYARVFPFADRNKVPDQTLSGRAGAGFDPRSQEFDRKREPLLTPASHYDQVGHWGSVKRATTIASSSERLGARTREQVLAERDKEGLLCKDKAREKDKMGIVSGAKKASNVIEEEVIVEEKSQTSTSSRPPTPSSPNLEPQGVTRLKKENIFGVGNPTEVLLEERGVDYRKIDLELERQPIVRPQSENEMELKEEFHSTEQVQILEVCVVENEIVIEQQTPPVINEVQIVTFAVSEVTAKTSTVGQLLGTRIIMEAINRIYHSVKLLFFMSRGKPMVPACGKPHVVPTNLSISIPEGTYAGITPRSGLAWKHSIDVVVGVIDADYHGIVVVILFNHATSGDRIAQLIIEKNNAGNMAEVWNGTDPSANYFGGDHYYSSYDYHFSGGCFGVAQKKYSKAIEARESMQREVRYMTVDGGTSGKVCIHGLIVIKECQNNSEATKTTFPFGWFHTGLIVYLDKEGYLFLIGRIKESIHRAGEKISPSEVDAVLLSYLEVAQDMAFGVPNNQYDEEMTFVVFPQENMKVNEDEIANLANQECFKMLEETTDEDYRFLDFMLRGSTGVCYGGAQEQEQETLIECILHLQIAVFLAMNLWVHLCLRKL
ncbi:hypothetical protein SUGI_0474000 [Cryptomeria japonica]|nr:hypothetical protein SUGI_0474000 [Cryptomeria japonica]